MQTQDDNTHGRIVIVLILVAIGITSALIHQQTGEPWAVSLILGIPIGYVAVYCLSYLYVGLFHDFDRRWEIITVCVYCVCTVGVTLASRRWLAWPHWLCVALGTVLGGVLAWWLLRLFVTKVLHLDDVQSSDSESLKHDSKD